MARMTEEEAWALDDEITKNEIKLGPNGSDWLSQRELFQLGMNKLTVNYLTTKAAADHTSPGEIINGMVREKIAAIA